MKPLVIFDCDGVLVDSEPIASAVLADHLTAAGMPHTPRQCRERFTGLSLHSCQQMLEAESGKPLPAGFFDALQRDTFARFEAMLQPVPGIVTVLECLRDWGWDVCVASSGGHDKMAVTLGITGLGDYFAGRIFSASDVARGKPAPDLFLHAAARLGFAASQCIVVEDSPPGVQAALAARMAVCAFVAQPPLSGGLCESADAQAFTAMPELPDLLLSIHARRRRVPER